MLFLQQQLLNAQLVIRLLIEYQLLIRIFDVHVLQNIIKMLQKFVKIVIILVQHAKDQVRWIAFPVQMRCKEFLEYQQTHFPKIAFVKY